MPFLLVGEGRGFIRSVCVDKYVHTSITVNGPGKLVFTATGTFSIVSRRSHPELGGGPSFRPRMGSRCQICIYKSELSRWRGRESPAPTLSGCPWRGAALQTRSSTGSKSGQGSYRFSTVMTANPGAAFKIHRQNPDRS